ncbi:MAG TPA: prephenate dehydrogenase/arogenate dehydrogenase family protein [Candidatus Methylacidiphilales bacterium]|nr:prephenate dehydrogenase/arogenate dehydrogenase family protein [Candidatus Methylacidiphilales bacterium]
MTIIGPGLIGGSLALALTERKLADRLVVYARSKSALIELQSACPGAELTTDAKQALKDADMVVLCIPIESMFAFVAPVAHLFKSSAVVTDVGSVKSRVERDLAPLLINNAHWIGSHPMAGSEKSGFGAARANLFDGATVVITPTAKTSLVADKRAEEFWRAVGGCVVRVDPETHDNYVAQISHLPHLVAAALVNHSSTEARELAGGGFRDTTRVASGSPELWTEILAANAKPLVKNIDDFIHQLLRFRFALEPEPGSANPFTSLLLKALQKAQRTRSELLEKKPNFHKRP